MMKTLYLVVGGVLVLVGIVGFVMPSPLFGLFEVNALHNIVHVASGALAILAATQGVGAMRTFGRIFGIVYLAIGIAGFVTPDLFGLMHVNTPDNLLHIGIAAVFLYAGLIAPPRP
jgi:hypothetical protein